MNVKAATLIVTWFGAGKISKAPGTVGSLAALPFAYVIQSIGGNFSLMIASVLLFVLGVVACEYYLRAYPEKDDPKEVVVDEVAAQWLLLSAFVPTPLTYLVAFTLFRIFDVLKPWPICLADRKIGGGFGIMFDDLLAAIYPAVCFIFIWAVLQIFGASDVLSNITFMLVRM